MKETVRKYEDKIVELTSEFFASKKDAVEIDEMLNILFTHLANVIYCCMDEGHQKDPRDAARAMGEVLEQRIEKITKKVEAKKAILGLVGVMFGTDRETMQ